MGCFSKVDTTYEVSTEAAGFGKVVDAFKRNFDKGLDEAAQFVVYYKGEKVVDISGKKHVKRLETYDSNSVNIVFSSGKTIVAFAVAWLVDQGRISYSDKVSTHWPEFGQNGKEDITIERVMRHEGGLPFIERQITKEMMQPANYNKLKEALENAEPVWKRVKNIQPSDRVYHATTRAFIIDEICRRVDAEKRTLSELMAYLSARVSDITGEKMSHYIGRLDEEKKKQVVLHTFKDPVRNQMVLMTRLALPFLMEKPEKRHHVPKEIMDEHKRLLVEAKNQKKKSLAMKTYKGTANTFFRFPTLETMNFEAASFNTATNARSLAAFGQAFIFAPAEERLISDETRDLLVSNLEQKVDLGIMLPTTMSKGGVGKFAEAMYPEFIHSFYGWQGYGGSVFGFSLENDLSIAYVPNRLDVICFGGFFDKRCLGILKPLMEVTAPH